MAITPAVGRAGLTWHTRANWSARDDRRPYLVWLALIWFGTIAGFGTDMSRFLHEAPPAPKAVDLHAFVFTGWLLLLTAQVLLVADDRVGWHKKLGWLTAAWTLPMCFMGPWAAFAEQAVVVGGPDYDPPYLAVQLGNICWFLLFLAWGIALRKNAAGHKRIMILSTVALIDAGFTRFAQWIWPAEPASRMVWFFWTFYGNVLLMALMTAWDWRRGRLMKQFVLGAAFLVAMEMVETLLYFWGPWKVFAAGLVATWARHFG